MEILLILAMSAFGYILFGCGNGGHNAKCIKSVPPPPPLRKQ